MRVIKVLLVIIFIITTSLVSNSQNLSAKLGSVRTEFKLYSGNTDLNVNDQFIIKNAGEQAYYDITSGGVGVGYESYHLEFLDK